MWETFSLFHSLAEALKVAFLRISLVDTFIVLLVWCIGLRQTSHFYKCFYLYSYFNINFEILDGILVDMSFYLSFKMHT